MSRARLIGTYQIALLPGVKEADFEKFMEEEVLPNVEVFSKGVNSWSQSFLKLYEGNREDKYLWRVALEHFGSEHSVPNAIPSILREIYEKHRDKIETFGVRTSFAMFSELSKQGL
jgi:hypothetical protein